VDVLISESVDCELKANYMELIRIPLFSHVPVYLNLLAKTFTSLRNGVYHAIQNVGVGHFEYVVQPMPLVSFIISCAFSILIEISLQFSKK
jgi:hypothetical protein